MKRLGFTLMEVNLAILLMSMGVLGFVALYSLGYRENRQSLEDVRGAAAAAANVNAIVAALSSTNMTWSQWQSIGTKPSSGWTAYLDNPNSDHPKVSTRATSIASGVFGAIPNINADFITGDLACGLVVVQKGTRCTVAMRSGRRTGELFHQPLYYTEVTFQGLKDD